MTATAQAIGLIAANPGPAAHLALLGIIIVIGLTVFAVARLRRKREAAEADELDRPHEPSKHERPGESQ